MIVRHFLQWVRTAGAGERAEATSALARAYLYSELSSDDRAAAEGALLMQLDDPSPLVRRALADALAASPSAPPAVIFALAADQPQIAAPVYALSPLFVDADLVDAVASGSAAIQAAIAARPMLPRSVAAAIIEVGTAESCLVLLENQSAEITPFSIDRAVERHGHLAAIREALLARVEVTLPARQRLLAKLSETLVGFALGREWLDPGQASRIVREACEKATVALAADTAEDEIRPLIRHLRASGQLTAGLILRALLSGNVVLFEEALAELADMPVARVSGLLHDRGSSGLRPLFERAGLPPSTYPAFKEAIEAMHEGGFVSAPGGAVRLKRRMIERVLTRCEHEDDAELAPLITLLHRFATEAARDEARLFCDELAADAIAAEQESCRRLSARRRNRCGWSPEGAISGAGDDRRSEDILQIVRPKAILGLEKLVGHLAEPLGDGLRQVDEIGSAVFAHHGTESIDMLVDQRKRNPRQVRAVFKQPAQAFCDPGQSRIAESGGLSLDVVGGAEQFVAGLLGKIFRDLAACRFKPLAFRQHPVAELT